MVSSNETYLVSNVKGEKIQYFRYITLVLPRARFKYEYKKKFELQTNELRASRFNVMNDNAIFLCK